MNTEKTSVNWYAHGARYYDPQLARWHASDPLSELYSSSSPYAYVRNNPVNFIDPNGMYEDRGPSADERNGRYNYDYSGYSFTSGTRRLQADPYSWNNVGRFMSDPGPGRPYTDENGDTYTPFQDPVSGMYYYDVEHEAYSEPYYSNESVLGYSHKYDSSSENWTYSHYQKAGVVYHSAYTERIYLDAFGGSDIEYLSFLNGDIYQGGAVAILLVNSASTNAWTTSIKYVKIGSAEAQAQKVLSKIARGSKYVGWVGTTLSLGVSYTEAYVNRNNQNAGFYQAQAIGSTLIIGLNAFNFVVPGLGTVLSISAGAIDAAGGFDWIYNSFND